MAECAARRNLRWVWICLCAAAAYWSLVAGQNSDTTVMQVPENQPVSLPCKASGTKGTDKRIEWKLKKDGGTSLIYFENKFADGYQDRATFYTSEIHLNSVTRKDTGLYLCEVVGTNGFAQSTVDLIVQVPPSKPVAHVPSTVIIGTKAALTCVETDGSPPPTFKWFKNNVQMPTDPKISSVFKNSSYTLDPKTGVLTFDPAMAFDAGDYSCEASNNIGVPQLSEVVHMELSEVNVGAIVAAVVVLLIILGLVAFGIWFAYSRGYFSKRTDTTNKKVIYSQPSTRSDGEFKQTSSFLV